MAAAADRFRRARFRRLTQPVRKQGKALLLAGLLHHCRWGKPLAPFAFLYGLLHRRFLCSLLRRSLFRRGLRSRLLCRRFLHGSGLLRGGITDRLLGWHSPGRGLVVSGGSSQAVDQAVTEGLAVTRPQLSENTPGISVGSVECLKCLSHRN
jgi:hypothetical protein